MTSPRRTRRVALLGAAVLVGAGLPVALAPSASAEPGCLSESAGFGEQRCDDSSPPQTTLESVSPEANAAGYINSDSLTYTFSAAYDDADADPIGFECQFYGGSTSNQGWQDCSSPVTYSNLDDTSSLPYTFKVRAYDKADVAIDATSPTIPIIGTGGADTDLADYDESEAVSTTYIDTRAPVSYIFNTPYDPDTPDLPMILTNSPTFRLAASEKSVDFTCTINGDVFPCHDGNSTFSKLSPGTKTLKVSTEDVAGNVEQNGPSFDFTVPEDLTTDNAKWRSFTSRKSFGGSYLETTAYNARLAVRGEEAREVRLICTVGPDTGILKYKVPGGVWQKVKMRAKKTKRNQVVTLRQPSGKAFTGLFKLKTFSRGKPVAVDAIMLR